MLDKYKEEITRLVLSMSHISNLEIAVFNENSNIIAATDEYLHKKGNSVHKPSLMEVISNGNILVNKPGHMPSCKGCRFQDNCPSTIEILNTINSNGRPVGVISFTSFTPEGHDRMIQNLDSYIDLVADLSHMISMFTQNDGFESVNNSTYEEALKLSNETLLVTDKNGSVTFASESAKTLLPDCTLYSISLWSLFPSLALNKSIKHEIQTMHIEIGERVFDGMLKPILEKGSVSGYVLKLESSSKKKLSKHLQNEKAFNIELFLLGESSEIEKCRDSIVRFSKSDSTVIISGETGTGKELAARSIHNLSKRSRHPFISVNCASIPESLFESELFGYEEGAFTGAKRGGKPGKFELAQMGTLFLDEIGELPHFMQAKLLRVLQEHYVERVGGTRTIPIDVRIITATNQNLEEMIREKRFRADLFFRLNVIPLVMPPLSERSGDPGLLAAHFLVKHCKRQNRKIIGFHQGVTEILSSYHWPGNVRELENAIEYAINMEESDRISVGSLPAYLTALNCIPERLDSEQSRISSSFKNSKDLLEQQLIRELLNHYGWDGIGKEKAASKMGVSLRTFYRKIKNLGINERGAL